MTQDDAHLARAGKEGREDEPLLAHRQKTTAHRARQECPTDQRENDRDAEIDPDA